ncbi:MAG: dTDP-4-dehydrorhamnose reductase [Neisseriales bacterium]|nr:MAG: dTDP-4-dehydrorhamnose reductase [Neisseriales bacterium]
MAKVVILGSNGQLGSDLCKVLAPNYELINSTSADINAAAANVSSQLATYSDVDYIINCIATTNVDGCESNPQQAFLVNSAFAVQLAQFCTANQIILIHISTDYVFDGTSPNAYLENDQPNPLNVYGLSKYAGEIAVKTYADKYFILRVSSLFGVAGASGKGGNFVTTMLRLAREKDNWTVISDQITCPTHTLDVARAIKALIEQQVSDYGIYNCVSSSACSWFEFTQEILRQSGQDVNKVKPISYKDYSFKALRPQYAILDSTKIAPYYVMPDYKSALSEYLSLSLWLNGKN